MISDVDKTIEKLMQFELGAPLPFDISFVLPDKEFAPVSESRHTLNCYLYDISEDRELRSNEQQQIHRGDGIVEKKPPPARIRLSYCLTAWSPAKATSGIEPALDEHKLLSQVLVALFKYPLLPPGVLQGRLKEQEIPIPTTIAMPDGIKNPGDFWNAIGGQLRPSLDFRLTIALEYKKSTTAAEVSSKMIQYKEVGEPQIKDQFIRIGGYVRDSRTPPVPVKDAWVLLEEIGKAGKTDRKGCFRFGNLRQGTYTLSVRAKGYRDQGKKVTVPGARGEYHIQLKPEKQDG